VRFFSKALSSHWKIQRPFALCRLSGFRPPFALGTLLAVLICPGSGLADGFDIALHGAETVSGEISAAYGLGPVSLNARHVEYLGYINQAYRSEGAEEADPLVRSSEIEGGGLLDSGIGAVFPLGLTVALDEWESGDRDLSLTARSGLNLPGFRVDHRLSSTTSFTTEGSDSRYSAGRLALGFDFLGGRQESVVEYDVEPISRITGLGFSSDWDFDDGASALLSLSHNPIDAVSEARFGFRQAVGPFDMSSDLSADSLGTYTLGVSLSLALDEEPEATSLSLAAAMAALSGAN